jgi:hypothetical protein
VIRTQLSHLLREDPSLEQDLPRLQTDRRALQRILDRSLSRWMSAPEESEGLETWQAFYRRVQEGLACSLSDRETIQLSWQVRNASVSTFKFNRVRLTLSSFKNMAHLEMKREPELLTYR